MDLTKTVTKVFPTENEVGLHLKLQDDGITVIDDDFIENFAVGESIPNEVRDSIGHRMQAAINKYKKLKSRFDAAVYETVRTQIDSNLIL